MLSVGSNAHHRPEVTQTYVRTGGGSKIVLNPIPGTSGITNSLVFHTSGYSSFSNSIRKIQRGCKLMRPVIPSSADGGCDATFHMCVLGSLWLSRQGQVRPSFKMCILVSLWHSRRWCHVAGRHLMEGRVSQGVVDRITSQ